MSTYPENPFIERPLRSFGRIKSRAIKPRQAALFDTLLPSIALPDPKAGPLDPVALMPEAGTVWLEIGFGGGEHLAEQAARHPDALMIGCEPFLNGVASALRHIDDRDLKNVRLHADDARRAGRPARRVAGPDHDPVPRPLAQGPPQQAPSAQ